MAAEIPIQSKMMSIADIFDAYVHDPVKLPWYIDLLNITLGTHDLAAAKQRSVAGESIDDERSSTTTRRVGRRSSWISWPPQPPMLLPPTRSVCS